MTAYVVRGECGEYSDYRFWEVKAFASEALANALRDELNAWCIANSVHKDTNSADLRSRSAVPTCPIDPEFETDYTGTEYLVWSIEVQP